MKVLTRLRGKKGNRVASQMVLGGAVEDVTHVGHVRERNQQIGRLSVYDQA